MLGWVRENWAQRMADGVGWLCALIFGERSRDRNRDRDDDTMVVEDHQDEIV